MRMINLMIYIKLWIKINNDINIYDIYFSIIQLYYVYLFILFECFYNI